MESAVLKYLVLDLVSMWILPVYTLVILKLVCYIIHNYSLIISIGNYMSRQYGCMVWDVMQQLRLLILSI